MAAVGEVIDSFGLEIPYFGMVKDDRHRTRAIARQGGEIAISTFKSAFSLVTRIQDEVHRYTISYQRKVHKKTTFELELTKIKGIGEKKALALFRHFKTKTAFRQADVDEIAKVGKITTEKAKEIQQFMNNIS